MCGSAHTRSRQPDCLKNVDPCQDPKRNVTDLRFNPEGSVLAVASEDCAIYLYDALHNFKLRSRLDRHGAAVRHLDFSRDGMHLMSQDDLGQVILWTLEEEDAPVDMGAGPLIAQTAWNTRACTVGWDTVGLFPAGVLNSFVTSTCRSPDHSFLVSADVQGAVKLFTYPAHQNGHLGRTYHVHSRERVNQVSIANDGVTVVSVGRDRSVVQWRLASQEAVRSDAQVEDEEPTGTDEHASTTVDGPNHVMQPDMAQAEFTRLIWAAESHGVLGRLPAAAEDEPAELEEQQSAEEFELLLRGVLGARIAPECPPGYGSEGSVLIAAGNICASLDSENRLSSAALLWPGLVTACAWSNHGVCAVATRSGRLNKLQVWETAGVTTTCCVEVLAPAAFKQLRFSADDKQLVGHCDDAQNTMFVWRASDHSWTDVHLVSEFASHFGKVHASMPLTRFGEAGVNAEAAVVTCSPLAEGLLTFWYVRNGLARGQACCGSKREDLHECVSLAELANGKVMAVP